MNNRGPQVWKVSSHLILKKKKVTYLGQMVPLSPSKYSPWDLTHALVFLPLYKILCKVLSWDHHQLHHCILLNFVHDVGPWSVSLLQLTDLGDACFAKRKKPCPRYKQWADMFSWFWSCQSPLAHSCGHFLLAAPLSWWRTLMQYSLLSGLKEYLWTTLQAPENTINMALTWRWSDFAMPSFVIGTQVTFIGSAGL